MMFPFQKKKSQQTLLLCLTIFTGMVSFFHVLRLKLSTANICYQFLQSGDIHGVSKHKLDHI